VKIHACISGECVLPLSLRSASSEKWICSGENRKNKNVSLASFIFCRKCVPLSLAGLVFVFYGKLRAVLQASHAMHTIARPLRIAVHHLDVIQNA
jgi:hypothetical protein